MLCNNIYVEQNGEPEDKGNDIHSDLDHETSTALQMLAQMCGQADMPSCLSLFIEKIVHNLMSSHSSPRPEEKRLIEKTLDVFNAYLANHISSRQIANLPITKQLAEAHINQFNILQGANQMK